LASAQVLCQSTWLRTYGGSGEDKANGIAYAADGGFVIVGSTSSNNGEFDGRNRGGDDIFITRFNRSGDVIWTTVIGGSKSDQGKAICATSDGGWVVTGLTESNDGDFKDQLKGFRSAVLLKLKDDGSVTLTKVFGGSYAAEGTSIISEPDGSVVITGSTASIDGDVAGNRHGFYDAFAIKVDSNGTILWGHAYGGSRSDFAMSIVKINDGSYAITGNSESNDGDVAGQSLTGANSIPHIMVIKIDSVGALQWAKLFGGLGEDFGTSISVSPTGVLAVAGYTSSRTGDFANLGVSTIDMFLITVSPSGDLVWAKRFGGRRFDYGRAVVPTPDNGWMLTGEAISFDGMFEGMSRGGGTDIYVIRVDQHGDILWKRSIGGEWYEVGSSIVLTPDGCLVTGWTNSDNGDFLGTNRGNNDLFVAALDSNGNFGTTSVIEGRSGLHSSIAVYPNPSESTSTVCYTIQRPAICHFELIDRLGTVVLSTDLGLMDPGTHTLPIVASSLASGFYIARMWVGGEALSTPFVAVR
jgi:hypothetical protein